MRQHTGRKIESTLPKRGAVLFKTPDARGTALKKRKAAAATIFRRSEFHSAMVVPPYMTLRSQQYLEQVYLHKTGLEDAIRVSFRLTPPP